MIYIAVPYSDPDGFKRQARYESVTAYAAYLSKKNQIVFSPITHGHPMAISHDLPTGWEYWKKVDEFFVGVATEVHVLMLDGWPESKGVKNEVKIASDSGIPIYYINKKTYMKEASCS